MSIEELLKSSGLGSETLNTGSREIKRLIIIQSDGSETSFTPKDALFVSGIEVSLEDIAERALKREEFWVEAKDSHVVEHRMTVPKHEWEDPELSHKDTQADIFYFISDVVQVIVFH